MSFLTVGGTVGWAPTMSLPHTSALRVMPIVLQTTDYVVEQHDWESGPNAQFDYPCDKIAEGLNVVRTGNTGLLPLLRGLREFEFFRFYAVDLLASCSYMPTHEAVSSGVAE